MTREQRRLAAVLAADVVGYSRLMGRDEAGTLARLRTHRLERLEPILARRGGRIVKLTGDGALIEFASAVEAVSAAIEFQQAMADANAGVPDETAIVFRIGAHLGDLIVEGDDLYGDGVNVAARLEAEAPAGGIMISGDVSNAVSGRLKAKFADLGDLMLKNIERPMRAFRVEWSRADWPVTTAEPASSAASDERLPLPDKPSIAVLPFTNMSGDPEQEHFADGIAEDIITALARFRQFHVIARNSTFTYKGQPVDIKRVGRELGVRYVLEGSVRKAADRLRVTAQLIDAEFGGHVWADRYDGRLESIFDLQDEITNAIAAAVTPAFATAELRRVGRKHPESLNAWELTVRASQAMAPGGAADVAQARLLAERALALDPGHLAALRILSACHTTEGWLGFSPSPRASVEKGIEIARLALREDNADPAAMVSLGRGFVAAYRFEEAREILHEAVTLNPNLANGLVTYGTALGFLGEYDRAIEEISRGVRLSPREPGVGKSISLMAFMAFAAGRYEQSIGYARRTIQDTPDYLPGPRNLAASLAALGHLGEARLALADALRIMPNLTLATVDLLPYQNEEVRMRYRTALASAGLRE